MVGPREHDGSEIPWNHTDSCSTAVVAQNDLTFQDDNAYPHRARIVVDYVQQQSIHTLP